MIQVVLYEKSYRLKSSIGSTGSVFEGVPFLSSHPLLRLKGDIHECLEIIEAK